MHAPASSRPVQAGPFARVHDRDELFADLSYAVRPDSARSVLVLFGFEGLKEHLELVTPSDGDELLGRFAERLAGAIGTAAVLYEPRRGEFCAIFDGSLTAVRQHLVTIPTELDEEARAFHIRSSLGIAVLPDEAPVPTYAMALADRRLRALSGNLRPERLDHDD